MNAPENRVLVVDDDPKVLATLKRFLSPKGYRVLTSKEGSSALGMAVEVRPDLVISDVEIPDMDGFKLCRLLKADPRTFDVPVILISGRVIDETSVISGLENGADDYLIKPFTGPMLLARVRSVLRRYQAPKRMERTLRSRGLELDPERRTVKVRGRPVELTRKEFDLLAVLLDSSGRVLPPLTLLQELWGCDPAQYNDPHTVEVHVSRLRKKLGAKLGKRIVRVTGVGFKFEA